VARRNSDDRNGAVTIADVAKTAGVSPMTVSNVINDHPYVRQATREKVLAAMAQLGYRVNVAARNLRSGRTGTIGLAIPEIDRPYYGQLAAAIMAAAAGSGLRVVVEQTRSQRENELEALALSRNRLYDGLLLSTVGLGPADTKLLKVDYPVVLLGERIFGGPVDHVAMPNVDGARAATAHLLERGCRRIALIDSGHDGDVDVSQLRFAGYRAALDDAGVGLDPDLLFEIDAFTMEAGARIARHIAASALAVDGVFCITDTVGVGVLRGFADAGVAVPCQVKVIGFDNVDSSAYTVPSLSSVDPDHGFMAKSAVELLVKRIAKAADPGRPQDVVSTFAVVARESTAACTTHSH